MLRLLWGKPLLRGLWAPAIGKQNEIDVLGAIRNDANLRLYLKLEASGVDSSGNGLDFTASGSPTYAAGKFGNGVLLARASSQYLYRDVNVLNSNTFSLILWVKPTTTPSGGQRQGLYQERDSGGTNRWLIEYSDNAGTPYLEVVNQGGSTPSITVSKTLPVGIQSCLIVTQDATAGVMILYLNGKEIGRATGTMTLSAVATATPRVMIGNFTYATTRLLDAMVDDLAIINRVLTPGEVGAISGEYAYDFSGQKHNGYIKNTPIVRGYADSPAWKFDGSTSAVIIPDPGSGCSPAYFTLHILVNPIALPSSGNAVRLISKRGSGGSPSGWDVSIFNSSGIYKIQHQGPGGGTEASWDYKLPVGRWTLLTITRENGTAAKLYVNGACKGASGNWSMSNASVDINIGRSAQADGYANANVQFAALYARTWKQSEISDLVNAIGLGGVRTAKLNPVRIFARAIAVSVANAASRGATIVRRLTAKRSGSATVATAASRGATAVKVRGIVRHVYVSVANAVSRFAAAIFNHIILATGHYLVLINNEDVSSAVIMGSVKKKENINQHTDSLQLSMRKYGDMEYTPAEGDEIDVYDPLGAKVFSGILQRTTKSLDGHAMLQYDLEFVGYVAQLETRIVTEKYESTTGNDIISDLRDTYAPDFSIDDVDADFPVEGLAFNRVTMKEAIDKLAKFSNYTWYVDYEKGIHFFPRYTEEAPLEITDESENYIFDSLTVVDDYSQLRNRVFVRGAEIRGLERTEHKIADGTQLIIPLANKFAERPAVTVAGSPVTVGVDFLDADDTADCFWNYQEKYLRFKDDTKPAEGEDVATTGIPLYRLIVQVEDSGSIARLGGDPVGVHEYVIKDDDVKSEDDARARAQSELEAYASKVVEGEFDTYENGLRAGQIIHISSDIREAAGDFVIQSVQMSMVTKARALYHVELATLRTISVIDILIAAVRSGNKIIDDSSTDVLERFQFPQENIIIGESVARSVDAILPETLQISEVVGRNSGEPEYVYGPYSPSSYSDPKVGAKYGKAKYN